FYLCFFFFFFAHPLGSTLFPYTTLFRSWVSSIVFGSIACAIFGGALASFRFEATVVIVVAAIASGFSPIAYLLYMRYRRLEKCEDRKSTRLNSSHVSISYAVFCLKKKNT